MSYKPTKANIQDRRLHVSDFPEAASGITVKAFNAEDLPHHKKIVAGDELSPDEHFERTMAIYKHLAEAKVISNDERLVPENVNLASHLAMNDSPVISASRLIRVHLSRVSLCGHFNTIKRFGFDAANQKNWISYTSFGQRDDKRVLPGILSETKDTEFVDYRMISAACVFLPEQIASRQFWSRLVKIPRKLLRRFPQQDFGAFYEAISQLRSLQHVILSSPSNPAPDYYRNLDAALAARDATRQTGLGNETNQAYLHKYYLDMFDRDPSRWFAASLESIEAGQALRDFFDTQRAVLEVQIRVTASFTNDAADLIARTPSRVLQASIDLFLGKPLPAEIRKSFSGPTGAQIEEILDSCERMRLARPENISLPFCKALNRLVDDGAFSDPFARQIAEKIVEAGYYFAVKALTRPEAKRRFRKNKHSKNPN